MKEIVINDYNLKDEDIDCKKNKARAIFIKDNKLLCGIYKDVLMLPGGRVDGNESSEDTLIRELQEEMGYTYDISNFSKVINITYYQKEYPKRDGSFFNRLLSTDYYLGEFIDIDLSKTILTDEEKAVNFKLEFLSKEEILNRLFIETDNNKKFFFDKELNELLKIIDM